MKLDPRIKKVGNQLENAQNGISVFFERETIPEKQDLEEQINAYANSTQDIIRDTLEQIDSLLIEKKYLEFFDQMDKFKRGNALDVFSHETSVKASSLLLEKADALIDVIERLALLGNGSVKKTLATDFMDLSEAERVLLQNISDTYRETPKEERKMLVAQVFGRLKYFNIRVKF